MKIEMIVLGRAAPELYKQKQSVTVIGYSEKHGFIRLCPTRPEAPLKLWSMVVVEADRNAKDTRVESYVLSGEWDRQLESVKVLGELPRDDRISLIRSLARKGIESLRKGSLAIIKPLNLTASLEKSGARKTQKTLKGLDITNKADYEAKLYLEYNCSPDCSKKHRHWVIDWGVYEALRKSNQPEDMLASLHIANPSYEKFLLVGGKGRRFVIVGVLRFKIKREPESELPLRDDAV
jgi:hypothetical protein